VDKHVVAAVIARDEAEALFIVEKLDRTRCHRSVSVWPGRSTQQKSDRPMIASRQTQRSGGSPTSNGEHPGSLYVALNDVAPSPRA
jgi:hypothetical protein